MTDIAIENEKRGLVHPYKVILYLSMASILMFFAITTSALLVKKGDIVSWEAFKLPTVFYLSTAILLASSALMHYAKNLYAQTKFVSSRLFIFLSIILSIVFMYTQYLGFQSLEAIGMPLSGNASGSFVYVIVLAHAFHILGGLFFSILILMRSILNRNDTNFESNNIANPKRLLSLELLTIYWHFIDFIWVYLFIFFYFNY